MIQRFRTGCVVCGKPLVYFSETKTLKCSLCGDSFEASCACEDGHFVCDKCHASSAFDFITANALAWDGKNPIVFATELMNGECINMHGPEHHYLVSAALLACYKNSGADIDLAKCLEKANSRAKNVPGGICGLWGSCGAAVATGIFVSVITGATSLSVKEWSLANEMTSKSLSLIAKNGGPRCCKRNTYLAIQAATDFIEQNFSIKMEAESKITCKYYTNNKQCKGKDCIFFTLKI